MQNNMFLDNGISIDDNNLELFDKYRSMILEYNKIMDITNITEYEEMYIKHFIDSLYLNKADIDLNGKSLIDIGTGGGFPGIPLKIVYPSLKLTLLDSLRKRINFLDDVIDTLSLTNTKAIHGRAEDYANNVEYRQKFDIATSRAVAQLKTLVEYSLAYVKVGGHFIAMKGPNFEEELDEAKGAINSMGGKLKKVVTYHLPNEYGERTLIIIEKVRSTPKKYPRPQGQIKKNPL